jgi:hypothetical protein
MSNTKLLRINVGRNTYDRLVSRAEVERRSQQQIVIRALRQYLGDEPKPRAARRGNRPETKR